jgi:hypothetical protein
LEAVAGRERDVTSVVEVGVTGADVFHYINLGRRREERLIGLVHVFDFDEDCEQIEVVAAKNERMLLPYNFCLLRYNLP